MDIIPKTIPVARLREILDYDPMSGIFTWRDTRYRRAYAGEVAGGLKEEGYVVIKMDGVLYKAHRLAIAYVTGVEPSKHVDHRDGDRSNNRYANLRQANRSQNAQNRALSVKNTSGHLGVSRQKGRWKVQIQCDGSKVHLGYFDVLEEASAAYLAAKAQLHTFQPIPR